MTESKEIRLVDQDGEALASNFALCPLCAYILNINLHSQRSEDQSYDFCVKQAPSVPEASVDLSRTQSRLPSVVCPGGPRGWGLAKGHLVNAEVTFLIESKIGQDFKSCVIVLNIWGEKKHV